MKKRLATKTFETILLEAQQNNLLGIQAKNSLDWYYRKTIDATKTFTPNNLIVLRERWRKLAMWGNMFFFQYDPKTKDKLPYYDTFPLILVIDRKKNSFTGLNWHYLPPMLRANLLDNLMQIANNTKFDITTKIMVTYSYLKNTSRLKEFRPCFKKYLYSHVQSPFIRVKSLEWPIAIFLPVERFKKRRKAFVWKESINKI